MIALLAASGCRACRRGILAQLNVSKRLSSIEAAVDADPSRRDPCRDGRRRPRKRGRLHLRRRKGHAGNHQFHAQWPRAALRFAPARHLPAVEPAPHRGDNTTPLRTNFTVPVDHRSVRTGITAAERAATILALIDPKSQPDDFLRPGHVSPLIAKEGGVLRRAGHTEAAVDLARMAGLQPAGVLCEVLAGKRPAGHAATSFTSLPGGTTCI